MDKHEQYTMIYLSLDGGYSYRQTRVNEQQFKEKLWLTACKWLRPDSDMSMIGYGIDIIIRTKDLAHIGTLRITGNDDLKDNWHAINELWARIAETVWRE